MKAKNLPVEVPWIRAVGRLWVLKVLVKGDLRRGRFGRFGRWSFFLDVLRLFCC